MIFKIMYKSLPTLLILSSLLLMASDLDFLGKLSSILLFSSSCLLCIERSKLRYIKYGI